MQDFAYADIIILALIAVFIILRLRSTLGEKSGLMDMPAQHKRPELHLVEDDEPPAPVTPPILDENPEDYAAKGQVKTLPDKLKAFIELDPAFSAIAFLQGAESAFEMLLEAYDKDDRKTLRLLLNDELHKQFVEDLKERSKQDVTTHTTLVAIESARISDAEIDGKAMRLTVAYVSEQIQVEKDSEGNVVSGDPAQIDRIKDVWVFERYANASDLNWKIVDMDA